MSFVSRSAIISWFRQNGVSITSVEQIGTGAPLIMLLNNLYEDRSPSYKIANFKESPSNETEYLQNMHKVKEFLNNMNIKIYFPLERMVKCRMQDNLEFIQLLYKKVGKQEGSFINSSFGGQVSRNESKMVNNSVVKSEESVIEKPVKILPEEDHCPKREISGVGFEDTTQIISNEAVTQQNDSVNLQNAESLKQNHVCPSNHQMNEDVLKEVNELRYKVSQLRDAEATIESLQKQIKEMAEKSSTKIAKYKESYKRFEAEVNYYYNKLVTLEKLVKNEMEEGDLKKMLMEIFYSD